MRSFRRAILVATLVCQVFAGSLAPLAMAQAADASHASAAAAPCHGDAPADEPSAQHPCGCDAGACKCPCLHIAAVATVLVVQSPALIPDHPLLPESAPLTAYRSTSVFRPPI